MPLRRSCLPHHTCFRWCFALVLSFTSQAAFAGGEPRSSDVASAPSPNQAAVVEVDAIGGDAPPVREAVLRIQAELQAVGFGVRLAQGALDGGGAPSNAPAPLGRLLLVRSGNTVQILAHGAFLDAPLTQQVDLTRNNTTAEVLAIRAVEVLRAALVQSLRDKTLARESVPEAVLTFTQWSEAGRESPPPAPVATPVAPPASPPAPPEPPPTRRPENPRSDGWLFAVGPLLQRAAIAANPNGGAEAHLSRSFGDAFAGVLIDGSLSPSRWRSERGTVEAREASLVARGGANISCPENVLCQLGAGVGVRHWSFVATPNDPSASEEEKQHTSAVVEAEAVFGYFFDGQAGVLVDGRVGALLDAPTLLAGDEAADSWGRPSFGLAICGALRF